LTARDWTRFHFDADRSTVIGVATVFCILAFSLVFGQASEGAVRVWIVSPTFNHCFLVLPLSLFMIWQRRAEISRTPIAADVSGIVAVLCLGCVWVVVSFAGVLEAEQFVVMTMIQAALFGFFGEAIYRKLAAPFLYLYFLVPSGAFLVPALQAFTAQFAVLGLHLLRIPVFSTGAVIDIPAGTFAVAEACAGLRFLIASVAFGVFFAVLTYKSLWRRMLFIALSIIVPVVANGFRALGLIAAAEWIGSASAALADHLIYGWIFFSLVLVLLIFIGRSFSDRDDASTADSPLKSESVADPNELRRMGLVGISCVLMASLVSAAFSQLTASRSLALPKAGPHVNSPWQSEASTGDWKPMIAAPTRSFLESFTHGQQRVDRFVALYAEVGRANNLVRSENREANEKEWTFNSARSGQLKINNFDVPVRISTWLRGGEKRTVWSFFVVGGNPVATAWRAKLDQLQAHFAARNCISAYVALSTEGMDDNAASIAVAGVLASTEPLSPYLCGASTERIRRSAGK
jgi:exosortase A